MLAAALLPAAEWDHEKTHRVSPWWKATKELTQHGVRSDERRDDIGRTIRIESESQLESDPDTGRETVINGRKTVGSD